MNPDFSIHKQNMVELGDFEIQVGASSRDIRLKRTITVELIVLLMNKGIKDL